MSTSLEGGKRELHQGSKRLVGWKKSKPLVGYVRRGRGENFLGSVSGKPFVGFGRGELRE